MVKSLFLSRKLLWLSLGILVQGFILSTGCTAPSGAKVTQGTEIVVFVDFSDSIRKEARALFEQELAEQIIPSITSGDQILIAPITDKTLTEFSPIAEATFPAKPQYSGWSENRLKYKSQMNEIDAQEAQIRKRLITQVSNGFSKKYTSQQTDIFSSLILTRKLFHNVQRHKVLVLMSDMIEDYPPYHFEKIPWSPDTNQKLLTELHTKGLIPDLSDVCVYVTGVTAKSPEELENIGSFWRAYFRRAKADMDPSRYAHILLHWPPSKSCSLG